MVAHFANTTLSWLILAQEEVKPVLERIDPPRRAAIIMALLGLTLVGLFLIVLAMVGGHWARRLARQRPGASAKRSGSSSTDSVLRQSLSSILPEAKTDDTVQYGKSSPDTKVEGPPSAT
jgi:amino acid transporter